MREVGIGLLGFGTVGSGLVRALQANADILAERTGLRLVLRRIADLDLESDRGVTVDPAILTRDGASLVDDPAIEVVVELIGGTGAARDLVCRALRLGKPVVTANKALLARHGAEIFGLAAEKRTDIGYGASVGGAIPIIRVVREGLLAGRVESIRGIVNGTCNYILTRMETEGLPFVDALEAAQAEGYAEADPSLDIDGVDSAHKICILATLAFGACFAMSDIHIEGIRHVSDTDIRLARELGYRIKLLGIIRREGEAVNVRVHPTLVARTHMLAAVSGVFNGILVHTDLAGDTLCYGRGAGGVPTAGTVLADLVDCVRNLDAGCPCRVPAVALARQPLPVLPLGDVTTGSYLRITTWDKPALQKRILGVLLGRGIDVETVRCFDSGSANSKHLVVLTRPALERDLTAALHDIHAMTEGPGHVVRLRMEA